MERISRSWTLVKASWSVLRADKELLLFPELTVAENIFLGQTPKTGLGTIDWQTGTLELGGGTPNTFGGDTQAKAGVCCPVPLVNSGLTSHSGTTYASIGSSRR